MSARESNRAPVESSIKENAGRKAQAEVNGSGMRVKTTLKAGRAPRVDQPDPRNRPSSAGRPVRLTPDQFHWTEHGLAVSAKNGN